MKTMQETVIDHVASALEILEHERKDVGLGDEPTSGQEVLDYLREKPGHLFEETEEGERLRAPTPPDVLAALVAALEAMLSAYSYGPDFRVQAVIDADRTAANVKACAALESAKAAR